MLPKRTVDQIVALIGEHFLARPARALSDYRPVLAHDPEPRARRKGTTSNGNGNFSQLSAFGLEESAMIKKDRDALATTFFPQKRPAAALDQGQTGSDLIGTVHGEIKHESPLGLMNLDP